MITFVAKIKLSGNPSSYWNNAFDHTFRINFLKLLTKALKGFVLSI